MGTWPVGRGTGQRGRRRGCPISDNDPSPAGDKQPPSRALARTGISTGYHAGYALWPRALALALADTAAETSASSVPRTDPADTASNQPTRAQRYPLMRRPGTSTSPMAPGLPRELTWSSSLSACLIFMLARSCLLKGINKISRSCLSKGINKIS